MALSNYLAEIWGISIVVACLALLIKPTYLKKLFAEIENEASMFLWAMVSLVIGLTMVLAHNLWVKDWRVVITIFGWASLIKGLSFLFVPELVKNCTKKMENAPFLPYALVIAVFIGLVITYFGFTA